MDAVTQVPAPVNEPVHSYAPGSAERIRLEVKLKELAENPIDLPMTINGEKRMGGGEPFQVVQPHNHAAVLGTFNNATQKDAQDAIDAALAAAPAWRAMSFDDRAAIILRAAELLVSPWRETLAASTMLGQSKTAQQAEIDTPPASSSTSGASTCTSRARSSPSSRSPTPRACGTAATTGRWRASSTRSRPSTSPPSRATCRPPRP
ncbi:hypothetical protein GCM10020000_23640 [Streptomyces olivoverticillatus]